MSNETHGLPTSSNGGLIATGVVLLVLAAGLVFWKLNATDSNDVRIVEAVAPVTATEQKAKPKLNNAPPPPPPEEEVLEPEELDIPTEGAKAAPRTRDLCEGDCKGNVTPTLRSALAQRAAGARGCYEKGLRQNASLQGKVTVTVRVSQDGRTCSAVVTTSTLRDPLVEACVVGKFRSGELPPAQGGCVNVAVPINFTAEP
jgi:outer membrane biosynthesis protein TonB